jgi:hypothetical protein
MVGIISALVVSVVTGAIQLGGVQTHVTINTARLDLLETREHDDIADRARFKSRQEMNERRLDVIEGNRPTVGELAGITKSTDARIGGLEDRIRTLEMAPRAPTLLPGH